MGTLVPRGLLDATNSEGVVARWWSQCPDASPALALSASGLMALDVDLYKGDGEKLEALQATYGELPVTPMQFSGSGEGLHLVYSSPDFPVRGELKVPGREGAGVTLRSRNYLVMSPATHASGKTYRWVDGRAPWQVPVASLPAAWLEAVRRPVSASSAGVPAEEAEWLSAIPAEVRMANAQAHLARERGETRGVSPQGECFNVCRTTIRGYALRDPEAALALILRDYNAKCNPPYPAFEVARRVVAAYEDAEEPEWGARLKTPGQYLIEVTGLVPKPAEPPPVVAASPEVIAALAAVPAGDPRERFAGEMLLALDEVGSRLGTAEAAVAPTPLFEPAGDLFQRQFPPTPWLVRNLIVAGGVGAVSTEPKSAKTWLATEIAVAVATGTRVCGEFETGGPRRVAYFYAEDLGEQVRNKIRALGAARGMTPEEVCRNLYVQPRGRHLNLLKSEDVALLVASCRLAGGVDLLVLDPLRDLHGGEEDKADSMAVVMRSLRVLGDLLDCTVMFVHHSAKTSDTVSKRRGGQRMRGSSAIHGAVDFGLYLSGLEGDGQTEFKNVVESETKGARGAGTFSMMLKLEDDETGAAVRAMWTVDRSGKGMIEARRDEGDLTAVLTRVGELQAGGNLMSEHDLRNVVTGVPRARAIVAIKKLLGDQKLIYVDGSFVNRFGTMTRRMVLALPGYKPAGVNGHPVDAVPDPAIAGWVGVARRA